MGLAKLTDLMRRLVCAYGATVLLIEHHMETVMSISQQVVLLVQGAVVIAGTPEEVKNSRTMLEAYLGKKHGCLISPTFMPATDASGFCTAISLRVGKREVVALLGHNGAGKSTLLETIFGFVAVERGRIIARRQRHLVRARARPDQKGHRLCRAGRAGILPAYCPRQPADGRQRHCRPQRSHRSG